MFNTFASSLSGVVLVLCSHSTILHPFFSMVIVSLVLALFLYTLLPIRHLDVNLASPYPIFYFCLLVLQLYRIATLSYHSGVIGLPFLLLKYRCQLHIFSVRFLSYLLLVLRIEVLIPSTYLLRLLVLC